MKLLTYFALVAMTPVLALAQNPGELGAATSFLDNIIDFINGTLVPFVFALAFLVFIWGVFKYFIMGAADDTARESGKSLMLWGIIGFVLMVSLWGIVNLLAEGVGLEGGADEIDLPSAPGIGQ